MSLKLQLKNNLFKILDYLPEKTGYKLYHKIQGALNDKSMAEKLKSSHGSYHMLERIVKKLGISLTGKTILEIGSGWMPAMPYFMLYLGKAKAVNTYDLNHHYSKRYISELNRLFSSEFDIAVPVASANKYALPASITYHPETNLVNSDIFEPDLVFSRFVLEHVTPRDLKLMHSKFKKELNPGSFIIHLISPSDHRAYVDKSLSLQDFLRFSEEEWQRKQTKFDYHNRLRLPQYLAIFKAADLEVVHLEYDSSKKSSPNFRKFKALNLHSDFKQFTDEELTAGAINVVLKI